MNNFCKKFISSSFKLSTSLKQLSTRSYRILESSTCTSPTSIANISRRIQFQNLNFLGGVRFYVNQPEHKFPRANTRRDDDEDDDDTFPQRNFGNTRPSFGRFDRDRSSFGGNRSGGNFRRPGGGSKQPRNETVLDEEYSDAVVVDDNHEMHYETKGKNGFASYDIPKKLLDRLDQLGYKTPFEIQDATLKDTLAGKDLVGRAFTGSGKTLAFAIPIISRVMKSPRKDNSNPKCLVLSPTRELCIQLTKAIQELAPDLHCVSIFGGTKYEQQISQLNDGADIVIATPGRLRDLMQKRNFIPDDIELICLDEADEMLNPNFMEQIKDVIEQSHKDKQMLMFSATLNKNVAHLIDQYMKKPIFVDLTKGKTQKMPANIEHYLVKASPRDHVNLVANCIENLKSDRCIVFTNMKRTAMEFNYKLNNIGLKAHDLHSDLSQARREIIFKKFREGKIKVLVATDVASRGIDVPEVDLVIQVEAPSNGVDFYIHRSGRTGRAGRMGKSVLIHSGSADVLARELSRLVKFKTIDISSENRERHAIDEEDDEEIESVPRRKLGANFRDNNRDNFRDSRNFKSYKNRNDFYNKDRF